MKMLAALGGGAPLTTPAPTPDRGAGGAGAEGGGLKKGQKNAASTPALPSAKMVGSGAGAAASSNMAQEIAAAQAAADQPGDDYVDDSEDLIQGKGKVFKLKNDKGYRDYSAKISEMGTMPQRTFGKNAMKKFRMYSSAKLERMTNIDEGECLIQSLRFTLKFFHLIFVPTNYSGICFVSLCF